MWAICEWNVYQGDFEVWKENVLLKGMKCSGIHRVIILLSCKFSEIACACHEHSTGNQTFSFHSLVVHRTRTSFHFLLFPQKYFVPLQVMMFCSFKSNNLKTTNWHFQIYFEKNKDVTLYPSLTFLWLNWVETRILRNTSLYQVSK